MHRFRQLINRRLLQQSQISLPTGPISCGPQHHLSQWLPLQRDLSISCPSLLNSSSKHGMNSNLPGGGGGNGRRDGDEGDQTSNSSSAAYNTISDILNVTTKSRQDDSWVDKRASNDLSSINKDGSEQSLAEGEGANKKEGGDDPRPVLNYATGPGGTTKSGIVLGIETSCDDTGVAVVNTDRQILGEALNSQLQIHLNHGGIIPPVAKHLHDQHIVRIITEAMTEAKVTVKDLDAIATTVKPGLALSLLVGVKHGKRLCLEGNKPFIPIHHMKAHALTCRMLEDIQFPYLVLLVSGGHCLMAVAKSIDNFELLGSTIDDAPGEAFDKTARRLKLHNLPEGSSLSGGAAIEFYAKRGNPEAFKFPTPMYKYRDCNWSFSGLKFIALRHILREEREHGCDGPEVIPTYADLCASFQYSVVNHLCKKIQRGIIYADMKHLIPDNNRILVVSGGVACNNSVKKGLELVCQELNYKLFCPSHKLCTDNGVMIAWNGIEKYREGIEVIPPTELDSIDIESKSPMGISLHEEIRQMNIKCKRIKMIQLFQPEQSPPSGKVASSTSA